MSVKVKGTLVKDQDLRVNELVNGHATGPNFDSGDACSGERTGFTTVDRRFCQITDPARGVRFSSVVARGEPITETNSQILAHKGLRFKGIENSKEADAFMTRIYELVFG